MTMDYSPWFEREIWPFLRVAVSPKPERSRPPKLVYMNFPIFMNFLSRFRSIKFFDINPYLHEFFEPLIPDRLNFLMTMDYSPWVEREI